MYLLYYGNLFAYHNEHLFIYCSPCVISILNVDKNDLLTERAGFP